MNRIGKVKRMCHEWYASIMKRSTSHCQIGCLMMNVAGSSSSHWNSQKAKMWWIGELTGNQSYGRWTMHHNDIMPRLDYNHHHHKDVHVICKTIIHHENHSLLLINAVMYPMMRAIQGLTTMDISTRDDSHLCHERVGLQVNPLKQEIHHTSIDDNHISKQGLYIYKTERFSYDSYCATNIQYMINN